MQATEGGEKMVTVTIAVPEPVWLRLRRLAEVHRVNGRASVSALINRWLTERMAEEPVPDSGNGERTREAGSARRQHAPAGP